MPRKPAQKRPSRAVEKSDTKSDRKARDGAPLVVPPHGNGLLKQGGNHPRPGRPPNVVRAMLLNEAVDAVPVLRDVLQGQVVKRAAIPLSVVLKHATCPKCGGELQRRADDPAAATPAVMVTLEGMESASPGDRVRAWESFARYGIGTKDEVSVVSPDVRLRLERTVQLIAQQESWTSEDLLGRLDAIWSTED